MHSKTPARMVVVKKEEKESKLRDLIRTALAAAAQLDAPLTLRVLAVSTSSPVVSTIGSMADDLKAAGIEARVMLVRAPQATDAPLPLAVALRVLADARCHDAHELLVIGTETSWIGDSLRRDPAVRDSFELHAASDQKSAHFVAQSFDRLWQHAVGSPAGEDPAAMDLAGSLSAIGTAPEAMRALTRH
jgi:hypothetical protein